MIKQYKKLSQLGEKIRKGIDVKKDLKKPKHKKVKTFKEYFEECIRNKKIPEDTPPYLRKALERAILEYNKKTKLPSLLDYDEEKEFLKKSDQKKVLELIKNFALEFFKKMMVSNKNSLNK